MVRKTGNRKWEAGLLFFYFFFNISLFFLFFFFCFSSIYIYINLGDAFCGAKKDKREVILKSDYNVNNNDSN